MKRLSRSLLTIAAALACVTGCRTDAVKLHQGQLLLIQEPSGKAVIAFSSFGEKDGVSTYKWRYRAIAATNTESGVGKVFENYRSTTVVPGLHTLHDEGSQLNVTAGPVQVQWSYGSAGSYGWIYPCTNTLLMKLLDGISFDSYQP